MPTIGQDTFNFGEELLNEHFPDRGTGWSDYTTDSWGVWQNVAFSIQAEITYAVELTDLGNDEMDVSADWLFQVRLGQVINGVSFGAQPNFAAGKLMGVTARASTDNSLNQYEAYAQHLTDTTTTIVLARTVGGVKTVMGTATVAGVSGRIRLAIGNGTQKVYNNGVLVISTTQADATLAGRTYAGLMGKLEWIDYGHLDNWLSDDLIADGVDTLAVGITETASIFLTAQQINASSSVPVGMTGAATIREIIVVLASSSVSVGVSETARAPRHITATDAVPLALSEAVVVQRTASVYKAPVWRITSSDTTRLPHLATRDLEL